MFTMKGNQVPDFTNACLTNPAGFGGCTFTDLSELAAFGTPGS